MRCPTFITIILFSVTAQLAAAATPPAGVMLVADLQYVAGGDVSQRLDLYLPEKSTDKPLPIIVWVHGGGWSAGTKSQCPAIGYVKQGYAAASVEYRFSQKAIFPVSPVHYVTKDCPPFLIMHGTKDPLVPYAQSEELAEALRKAGVTVTLQKFPGAGHTGPAFHLPAARKLMQDFFDRNLKGKHVKVKAVPENDVTLPAAKKPGK